MAKKVIEETNGKGEPCKRRIYDGEKVVISSIMGGCEVVIRDKVSSIEIKIGDPESVNEVRLALNEICSDKAIK